MPRTRVKICGITNLEDALLAERLGADALGFNFHEPSSRYVTPAVAAEMSAALTPLVTRVGLFVNKTAEEVQDIISVVPLDVLQFHGDESEAYCLGFGRPYIKAVRANSAETMQAAVEQYASADMLLFDADTASGFGGTGETFDWQQLPNLERPYLLAGGLHPGNVADAIREVQPFGVDLSSGVETEKGRKDPEKMTAFFSAVASADTAEH